MPISNEFLDQSQAALEDVAQAFRPRLLDAWGNIAAELKPDDSPVTELDLQIEMAIRESLHPLDPSVGFEGEEYGREGSETTFWLVDPVDGTEQLRRGMPGFRIQATLIDEHVPRYVFVYDVPKDERYTARSGEGAFCNDEPLRLSDRPPEQAYIEYNGNLRLPEVVGLIPVIRDATRGVRMTGDFSHTLQGRMEGHLYYKSAGSGLDWVPWAVLIQEAGGRVANLGSDEYDYRDGNFLAATGPVFDRLKPLIDAALEGGEA